MTLWRLSNWLNELRNLPVSEPNEDSHVLCCKNKTDQ
ncbi:predicted coding region HP0678 [Helicobacter pylori 26695]|uniref:Uncharacterized protein n=1 Tax=Helicobacter pylori (strain ATCC 700392 / 26695) TaxID=85962 RepID=O25389_HELPY|nr:predicted coding region HP0678 [Helicobacter pylori 26695]